MCDALNEVIRVVLMQNGWPIYFLNKSLKKKKFLLTYEKEFLAIVLTIQKWRLYILG